MAPISGTTGERGYITDVLSTEHVVLALEFARSFFSTSACTCSPAGVMLPFSGPCFLTVWSYQAVSHQALLTFYSLEKTAASWGCLPPAACGSKGDAPDGNNFSPFTHRHGESLCYFWIIGIFRSSCRMYAVYLETFMKNTMLENALKAHQIRGCYFPAFCEMHSN